MKLFYLPLTAIFLNLASTPNNAILSDDYQRARLPEPKSVIAKYAPTEIPQDYTIKTLSIEEIIKENEINLGIRKR